MTDFLAPKENFGHPERTSSSSKHQMEKKDGSGSESGSITNI
jgi:hypothetical protein